MKKIILSGGVPLFILLFISAFTFGQKRIELNSAVSQKSNNTTIQDEKLPQSRSLMQKSIAVTSFGAFHEIAGAMDYNTKTHLLLKETGSGYPTIRMLGQASTPANERFWDIFGDVFGATSTDDYLVFQYGGSNVGFATSPAAKASIGILPNNLYNLQIHEPAAGTAVNLKMTNGTIGSTTTDGFDIGINNFGNAYMINQEGGSIGISSGGDGIMIKNGKVGMGNPFVGTTGKLEIYHNTTNVATTPHINLRTLNNASNGMIRMENSSGTNYFGQYFGLNSGTPANNFVSFDYNGTTPILDMQGNGNVKVSGFTTLGNDPAAPKIKVIELSSTMGTVSGGTISIAHGLTQSKIMSVSILVNATTNNDIPPSSSYAGFKYDYYISSTAIFISSVSGSDASILNRPVRLLVTYKQ